MVYIFDLFVNILNSFVCTVQPPIVLSPLDLAATSLNPTINDNDCDLEPF